VPDPLAQGPPSSAGSRGLGKHHPPGARRHHGHDRGRGRLPHRGGGPRGGAGQRVVAAPRSWDTHTEELNRRSAEEANLKAEKDLRIKMNTVIDAKGTTWGDLQRAREASRRPRIDPSDPFAPTRKYLNATEARELLPDKGNEKRDPGLFKIEMDSDGEEIPEDAKMRTPWYCPFCDVSVTNDDAYLDHINGKRHQKTMGYSMREKPETMDEITDAIEEGMHAARLRREDKERRLAMGESVSGEESWMISSSDEGRAKAYFANRVHPDGAFGGEGVDSASNPGPE